MITLKLNGKDHQLDVTEDMPLPVECLAQCSFFQGWQKAEA